MNILLPWTKYNTALSRTLLLIKHATEYNWTPTPYQKYYLYPILLHYYIESNELGIIWIELLHARPAAIITYLCRILQTAPRTQQRQLFLAYMRFIQDLAQCKPLRGYLLGIRAILKGKINRVGSARKQKIIWSYGSTRRAEFRQKIHIIRAQPRTSTGTLGLDLIFNYKDE